VSSRATNMLCDHAYGYVLLRFLFDFPIPSSGSSQGMGHLPWGFRHGEQSRYCDIALTQTACIVPYLTQCLLKSGNWLGRTSEQCCNFSPKRQTRPRGIRRQYIF
jgi:hypothetical protein